MVSLFVCHCCLLTTPCSSRFELSLYNFSTRAVIEQKQRRQQMTKLRHKKLWCRKTFCISVHIIISLVYLCSQSDLITICRKITNFYSPNTGISFPHRATPSTLIKKELFSKACNVTSFVLFSRTLFLPLPSSDPNR